MENTTDILATFNSPAIEKRLGEIKNRKEKNAFLESIMSNPNATVLNEKNGHKTILFTGNKGPKTNTWTQTKQMAFELNELGFDVAFLPELPLETSADSIVKFGNINRVADFKYCVTTKANTLVKDLEHGFEQANTIVLKLENMDSGSFKNAIDYMLRNEIPYGDIILMNKYGKVLTFSHRDIRNGSYSIKSKGFL